jgi:hypothetical protein
MFGLITAAMRLVKEKEKSVSVLIGHAKP